MANHVGSVCVYRRDPLFRAVERWGTPHPAILGAGYAIIFLAPKVLLTFLAGTLISASLRRDFFADLARSPLLQLVLGGSASSEVVGSTTIPYLRDYVDIGLCVVMAAHMGLLHTKWRNIGRLFTDLWNHEIINHKVFPSGRYQMLLRRFDALVNHRASYAVPLALSAFGWVMFFRLFSRDGIYSSIGEDRPWGMAAFAHWWANPANGILPFAFQSCWITFVLYYMLRHNVVGICAVALTWKIVRSASRRPLLLPVAHHHDKFFGVAILKTVMIEVYTSVILMGLGLLLAYHLMPEGASVWLVPFGMIFFGLNPFYILVPLWLVNRELRQSKRALIADARQRQALAADTTTKSLIEFEILGLEALPESLFSVRRVVTFIIMYLIPVILFLDWIYGKVHKKG